MRCSGFTRPTGQTLGVCLSCLHWVPQRAALQAQPVQGPMGVWSCPAWAALPATAQTEALRPPTVA